VEGKGSLQAVRALWPGHSLVTPEGWRRNFLTCPEAPKAAKSQTPPAMLAADNQMSYTFFTIPVAGEWRSPLTSSAPVLPLSGLTWAAVMTNNPSCVEPGNSLSPKPQPLLPPSQVDQDEWTPLFVLNSSGLPSSVKSGRDHCIPCDRHQKVLLSNLGLTTFVRHLVDLVKQVP
jgi:hypothetical protein